MFGDAAVVPLSARAGIGFASAAGVAADAAGTTGGASTGASSLATSFGASRTGSRGGAGSSLALDCKAFANAPAFSDATSVENSTVIGISSFVRAKLCPCQNIFTPTASARCKPSDTPSATRNAPAKRVARKSMRSVDVFGTDVLTSDQNLAVSATRKEIGSTGWKCVRL